MKEIKITREILEKIKPAEILYAEYSEAGAMGDCGTARIFTLENGSLRFYLVGDIFKNKKNAEIHAQIFSFLDGLAKNGKLVMEYAGFGNYAFRLSKIVFRRNDDEACFVYEEGEKTYKIPASCRGVYEHVVAEFAVREVPLTSLEEYFRKIQSLISVDEAILFDLYLSQARLFDGGQGWFDMSIFDYYNAVRYLRHLSGDDYILNTNELSVCARALYKYRLKYIQEKLGWDKLNNIFIQLVEGNKVDLMKRLDAALGEPVGGIYGTLETVHPEWKNLKDLKIEDLGSLFSKPVLVDFSKAAQNKILRTILKSSANFFNPNGRKIGCYFANYLLNEDKLSLADALPAATHTLEIMPDDDFNHTHTDELFWLCGQIVDQAWRYLEEDDAVQKKYRQLVYEIYWPRVGSLWPVLNYEKFKFKREATAKIFEDSWSFVMSLDDITELNGEIRALIEANIDKINYRAGALGRRAFAYSLRGLSSKESFERILDTIEPDDYEVFLSYPDTEEDAKVLLAELFKTDDTARITGHNRLAVLEALVLRSNTIGVGKYILDFLNKNFEQFAQIVSMEAINLVCDPVVTLADYFVAMSKGVTEENEFPALKSIKEKLLELGCDPVKLTNAEKYARHHRRTVLFQRSALQKFF